VSALQEQSKALTHELRDLKEQLKVLSSRSLTKEQACVSED
jgi:hypothetical protein